MTFIADFERQALETAVETSDALIRSILEAVCQRDKLSLESAITPGEPARNYELALRLGIGHVFGLSNTPASHENTIICDVSGHPGYGETILVCERKVRQMERGGGVGQWLFRVKDDHRQQRETKQPSQAIDT